MLLPAHLDFRAMKYTNVTIYSLTSLCLIFPGSAFAASTVTDYPELTERLLTIINAFIWYVVGIAIIYTLYQTLLYMMSGSNVQKRESAKGGMVYGIIAIAVALALWGFVWLLVNSFFSDSDSYAAPEEFDLPLLSEP